ncbi:MAG: hypothetical protein Q9P01_21885 [Anaerolineae bacterium]|nr:hypothetical protein [Anaerolineae bacterium]MDQ7037392.1 hypothetical protein [Anaerolineae bacterium]
MTPDIPPVTELMQPMDFNADDLAANREGRLGNNQRQRLEALQMRTLMIASSGFMGIGIAAATFFYFAQVNSSLVLQLMGIFVTIINALFVGMNGRQWMLLNADIRNADVELISGTMERVVKADERMNNFLLRIDGNDFYVKKELFKLFRHEVPYRLYRTQHAKILLAAEPTP